MWNVLRTKGCHEKIVKQGLDSRGIECYLPEVHRARHVGPGTGGPTKPLFSGYVFVRPLQHQFERLMYIPGSCGLVWEGSRPGRLQDAELEKIRTLVDSRLALEVHSVVQVGQRMKVVSGLLKGVEGEVVRICSEGRLILNVGLLGQSVSVEINGLDLGPCSAG